MSNRDKLTSPPPTDSAAALEQARAARRKLALTKSSLEAALKAAEARADTAEEQLEAALGLADLPTPTPIRQTKREGKGRTEAAYVMMASDWHVGERVRPEMVGGLNEYNPEIAQERAEKYFKSNLTMLNAARSAWDIEQVVFWWGGDFMTGYIHEEYQAENYLSPTEEMFLAYEVLLRGTRYILDKYDVGRVLIPTSSGNHGRGTKKKHTSDFRTSYEFLMYRMLAKALADEPRVQVQLGYGYVNQIDVFGFKIDAHHGDKIKSAGGIGGIYPPMYRWFRRRSSGAHMQMFGHHHIDGHPDGAAHNASLIGYSGYADGEGYAACDPTQRSFVVDSKRQTVGASYPIFVK